MILKNEKLNVTLVWLLLVAATIGSSQMSQNRLALDNAAAIIFAIASLKIFLIFFYFMELNHAPRKFLAIATFWLITVTVMVTIPSNF